jgi:hypothetical protein
VNLHILDYSWATSVALAAQAVFGIMTGIGTITAALTPRNQFVSGGAGQGIATGGMTLPGTPVLERVFSSLGTLAVTSYNPNGPHVYCVDGSIVLPPGTFAASYMSTASGASGFWGSFTWMEVPIP